MARMSKKKKKERSRRRATSEMYESAEAREAKATLKAIDKYMASIDTKEKAAALLIRIGILTKNGKRSKRYYPDDPEAE